MTEDYKVGYGKPPKNGRFKRGQSGNSKGRPKGTLNLKTDLEKELSERINIREGDRHLKVSKQRAMVKALVAKSLKGDARAATILIGLIGRLLNADAESEKVIGLDPEDSTILEDFLTRQLEGDSK